MEFLYYMNIGSNEKSGASISVEPVVSILCITSYYLPNTKLGMAGLAPQCPLCP
jgi:hypothetical protein